MNFLDEKRIHIVLDELMITSQCKLLSPRSFRCTRYFLIPFGMLYMNNLATNDDASENHEMLLFVVDIWTQSNTSQFFLGLTAHLIEKEFTKKTVELH